MEISSSKKIFKSIISLVLLIGAGLVIAKVYPYYFNPCSKPLTYSLGSFDDRFKITQSDFLQAVTEAEKIWEQPMNRELFKSNSTNPDLKINLVYDYRQEATDKLKSLGYSIDTTESSYKTLKIRYDYLLSAYNQQKTYLETLIADYEKRKKSYEQEVQKWNAQGGAPKNVVSRLTAEQQALEDLANKINKEKTYINSIVDEINALVSVLNTLAAQLNLNVATYNTIGSSRGSEFEEGVFVSDASGMQINIYEFSNKQQLIRLLAHELGHALGLDHIENPKAIMYRLNEGQNDRATPDDLNELKALCKIN